MIFAQLRRAGVLGMNRRNAMYTLRHNRRQHYPLVDDKVRTKRLCEEAGIPTPRLYAVARVHVQVAGLLAAVADHDDFVLKPARGAMGNGIVVITGREPRGLRRANGTRMTEAAFRYHAAGIISGLYSLAGQPDVAMIEERLVVHQVFEAISTQGVPDVRVLLYRGVPVMAMTRLPTAESGGRANLHQGAIGAGIDLDRGSTTFAVQHNRPCRVNPDSGVTVIGVPVPDFHRILEIAVQATDRTALGYVGADLVIDARHGPVVLELNARPGLAIQLANRAGLRPRLDAVDRTWHAGRSVIDRVALGRAIAREHGPLP